MQSENINAPRMLAFRGAFYILGLYGAYGDGSCAAKRCKNRAWLVAE